jgi:hypothetical protein
LRGWIHGRGGDGRLELSLNCAGTGESSVVSCKFFTSTSKREETLTWKSCSRLGLILDPDCRLEINPSPSKIVSPLKGKTPSVSSFAVGKLLERTSFRELQFSGTDVLLSMLSSRSSSGIPISVASSHFIKAPQSSVSGFRSRPKA